jgi:hypothetical protein
MGRIFETFAARFLLANRTEAEYKGSKANFGLWRRARVNSGSNGGIVRLLLTQAVVGIWELFVLLSGMEPTQMLPCPRRGL